MTAAWISHSLPMGSSRAHLWTPNTSKIKNAWLHIFGYIYCNDVFQHVFFSVMHHVTRRWQWRWFSVCPAGGSSASVMRHWAALTREQVRHKHCNEIMWRQWSQRWFDGRLILIDIKDCWCCRRILIHIIQCYCFHACIVLLHIYSSIYIVGQRCIASWVFTYFIWLGLVDMEAHLCQKKNFGLRVQDKKI